MALGGLVLLLLIGVVAMIGLIAAGFLMNKRGGGER
jgi:hypothetical protein